MDIGMFKNNRQYYNGYEGEPEIILSIKNHPDFNLHIWDGYFEDIFGAPIPANGDWKGFTRDYQECLNEFSGDSACYTIDSEEYLADLYKYQQKKFSYEESASCLNLLIAFLEYAVSISEKVDIFNS